MPGYEEPDYKIIWLNPDGSWTTNILKVWWGAETFRLFLNGNIVPNAFYQEE